MNISKNREEEGRNTRFKKILDALEANGSPKPEFETDEDRSYFITRLFIHEGFTKGVDESKDISKTGHVSDNEMKNETSFETSLKQVLKQKDYKKLELVIENEK